MSDRISKYFVFLVFLFLIFSGCFPFIPDYGHIPIDPYVVELKNLKLLPPEKRIEEYIRRHPEAGVRHLGWCGTPDSTAQYAFVSLLEDVPTRDIIPFLEHKAPLVRAAVHTLIRQRGQNLDELRRRWKRKGTIVDVETPQVTKSKEASKPPVVSSDDDDQYRWMYEQYKISNPNVLRDIKAAFQKGSARIRIELIRYIKPDVSDDDIYKLLDAIIHDPKLLVFQTDILTFSKIRSTSVKEYPLDVILFYRRLMTETDFIADKVDAINALGKFKADAAPAVPDLIKILEGKDQKLESFGVSMQWYGNQDDYTLRCVVAEALGDIGPAASAAIPELIRAIDDTNPYLPIYAQTALYLIGHEQEKMLKELGDKLKSESSIKVIPVLCDSLGKIGAPAASSLPDLERLARHDENIIRNSAINAISNITGSNDKVIAILKENLKHPNPAVREDTVNYFNRPDYFSKAEKEIYEVLKDPDPNVKFAVCKLLQNKHVSGEIILPALIEVIDIVPPPKRAEEAVEMIASFKTDARKAIPALLKMMECENDYLVQRAIKTTLAVGGNYDDIINRLIELAGNKNDKVACANMRVIETLGDKAWAALPVLREQYLSGVKERRYASQDALRKILPTIKADSPVPDEDLIALLECAPYDFSRDAVNALMRKNADMKPVAERLIELANDSDSRVSGQYLRELEQLRNLDVSILPKLRPLLSRDHVSYPSKELAKRIMKSIRPEDKVNISDIMLYLNCEERELARIAHDVILGHGGTNEQIVNRYLEIIKNEGKKRGEFAMQMLQELGPKAVKALPALAAIRKDKNHPLYNDAYYAIQTIIYNIKPDSGVDPSVLENILGDLDTGNATRAKEKIIELGGSLENAAKKMQINPELLNKDMLWTLGGLGEKAVDALPVLYQVSNDSTHPLNHDANYAMKQIIKKIGPGCKVDLNLLLQIVVSPDDELVRETVKAYERVSSDVTPMVDRLIESLSNPNRKIRLHVIQALRDLGAKAEKALPVMKSLPQTDDKDYNSILRYAIIGIEQDIAKQKAAK